MQSDLHSIKGSSQSKAPTSKTAICSVILGFLGFFSMLLGILAIILGLKARIDVRRKAGQLSGNGQGNAGETEESRVFEIGASRQASLSA